MCSYQEFWDLLLTGFKTSHLLILSLWSPATSFFDPSDEGSVASTFTAPPLGKPSPPPPKTKALFGTEVTGETTPDRRDRSLRDRRDGRAGASDPADGLAPDRHRS